MNYAVTYIGREQVWRAESTWHDAGFRTLFDSLVGGKMPLFSTKLISQLLSQLL